MRRFVCGAAIVLVIAWAVPHLWMGAPSRSAPGAGAPLVSDVAAAPAAATAPPSSGRHFFAAPAGSSRNPGTRDAPLDLATALSRRSPLRAGDTLWLLRGVYRGPFVSALTGTSAAPIQVKQYPGERAVIDGAAAPVTAPLTVNGADTWFWDFEVTNTSRDRSHERGIGVNVFGPRVRLINLVIHDTGNGVGLWSPSVESELSGNVIFDVGWQEKNQGKGHSVYVQNETGIKRLDGNVMFDGYAYGIHAYTEQGRIDNLDIEHNVSFNHGILSPTRDLKANILVGGWRTARFPTLLANMTYDAAGAGGREVQLGYWAGCDGAIVRDNYLAGDTPINLRWCTNVSMSGNRFLGRGVDADTARSFPDNTYAAAGTPASTDVFVDRNKYEPGRATIVVFNWRNQPSVDVDASRLGLEPGDRFRVVDAQNYFGQAVVESRYSPDMRLSLPMTLTATYQPIGGPRVTHTSSEFAVFLVQKNR